MSPTPGKSFFFREFYEKMDQAQETREKHEEEADKQSTCSATQEQLPYAQEQSGETGAAAEQQDEGRDTEREEACARDEACSQGEPQAQAREHGEGLDDGQGEPQAQTREHGEGLDDGQDEPQAQTREHGVGLDDGQGEGRADTCQDLLRDQLSLLRRVKPLAKRHYEHEKPRMRQAYESAKITAKKLYKRALPYLLSAGTILHQKLTAFNNWFSQ